MVQFRLAGIMVSFDRPIHKDLPFYNPPSLPLARVSTAQEIFPAEDVVKALFQWPV